MNIPSSIFDPVHSGRHGRAQLCGIDDCGGMRGDRGERAGRQAIGGVRGCKMANPLVFRPDEVDRPIPDRIVDHPVVDDEHSDQRGRERFLHLLAVLNCRDSIVSNRYRRTGRA